MRYLKSFNESDEYEYYATYMDEYFNSEDVDFTQREIEMIRIFIKPKLINFSFNKNKEEQYISINEFESGNIINNEYPGIVIIKSNDEWFYVRHRINNVRINSYYKCDQVEGLLTCLNDIVIPNK